MITSNMRTKFCIAEEMFCFIFLFWRKCGKDSHFSLLDYFVFMKDIQINEERQYIWFRMNKSVLLYNICTFLIGTIRNLPVYKQTKFGIMQRNLLQWQCGQKGHHNKESKITYHKNTKVVLNSFRYISATGLIFFVGVVSLGGLHIFSFSTICLVMLIYLFLMNYEKFTKLVWEQFNNLTVPKHWLFGNVWWQSVHARHVSDTSRWVSNPTTKNY